MADEALVVTGPTATGKTALSLEVAEELGGEIISMDSRQVYRGMDIGTAKPRLEQRARVPHHGIDLVEPRERYSAGRFARDARRWIGEIRARGSVPMLVGGTGFFLRALTEPLFEEPAMPVARRELLKRYLHRRPDADLERWVDVLDPSTSRELAARGGGAGRQRVARALEVALLTGRPLGWWHRHAPPSDPPVPVRVFVLSLPSPELDRRIDQRVHDMVAQGLVGEVEGLLRQGYDASDPGMNATGYIELIPYFDGERTLDEAVALIQRATRRYARRQLTWFRHQLPPGSVWLDAEAPRHDVARSIADAWRKEAF